MATSKAAIRVGGESTINATWFKPPLSWICSNGGFPPHPGTQLDNRQTAFCAPHNLTTIIPTMRNPFIRILPWFLTALIFGIILYHVPLRDVIATLQQVPIWAYLALMVPYSLFYCSIDAFVLHRIINWFHTRVTYRRVLPVRSAAYILALLNPSLGHGAVAFALHRREGFPLLEITGSLLFLTIIEFTQLALYATLGVFILHPHLRGGFVPIYLVLGLGIGGGMWCVRKGIDPLAHLCTTFGRWYHQDPTYRAPSRLQALGILQTIRKAEVRHYLLTLLYKAPNFFLAIVVHHVALQLFHIYIPFLYLLAFLPIVFLVASLPITVAHLGTTQGAWLYFFGDYGEPSQLLAYSLVAHVTFMILNGLIGLCFLPLALRGKAR